MTVTKALCDCERSEAISYVFGYTNLRYETLAVFPYKVFQGPRDLWIAKTEAMFENFSRDGSLAFQKNRSEFFKHQAPS